MLTLQQLDGKRECEEKTKQTVLVYDTKERTIHFH